MTRLRILLTGASGMVGRNLLEHPALSEFEVLTPRSTELDLRNFDEVRSYIEKHCPDIVIHAAGKVGGIQANLREPVGFLLENLDMGRNIVWAAHQVGVKRLLNLGSSCMYPRNHVEPLQEEMVLTGELEPTNEGYALAKIVTTRLCEYITREDPTFQYKTLIPCNLYGRYDKFHPEDSHLIPAIIHKIHIAKQQEAVTVDIWGDGTARREFMYAGDFADAVVHAVKRFDSLPDTMNIGLGYDFSISQYYQAAAELIGYEGVFSNDLSKPSGMARKLVSVERQTAWGWKPTTDLGTGLAKTYEFYLKECLQ